jgi:hypothetical protein
MMHKGLLAAAILMLCSACTGSLFDSDLPVPMSYVIASAPPGSLTGVPTTQADVSIGRPDFAPRLLPRRSLGQPQRGSRAEHARQQSQRSGFVS